jgi:hypothetical protein
VFDFFLNKINYFLIYIDKIVSFFQENKTSTTYKAVDLSKQTDVIIDISSKGKELHNLSLHCLGDENQENVVNYDEMFDCEIDGNVYSCAVLRFENPTLGAYIKNEIDKNVSLFTDTKGKDLDIADFNVKNGLLGVNRDCFLLLLPYRKWSNINIDNIRNVRILFF